MKRFWNWVIHVDRILRGESTRLEDFKGDKIAFPLGGVAVVLGVLGLIAGGCTGSFALFSRIFYGVEGNYSYYDGLMQFFASGIKVPLLFAFTLVVTFPSLYVFNTLVGAKLTIQSLLRLLTAALVVNMSVLAAFGPIVTFFAACTESYHFMILLNVTVFAVAGIIGMAFLVQSLNRIVLAHLLGIETGPEPKEKASTEKISLEDTGDQNAKTEEVLKLNSEELDKQVSEKIENLVTATLAEPPEVGPLDKVPHYTILSQVRRVFGFWIVIFGLVGAQMAWVLRPFIGSPDQPFTWFRERKSHFFAAVLDALQALLGIS
ncbi:MAG: hypothetical protein PVH19_14910 [Planctomycetia bacterium]|jgi:hypothetical protein